MSDKVVREVDGYVDVYNSDLTTKVRIKNPKSKIKSFSSKRGQLKTIEEAIHQGTVLPDFGFSGVTFMDEEFKPWAPLVDFVQ